jgi:biopolymer transport protein ExbD
MSKRRKRRSREESASPNLTPMIDVTFQLLIFFILCTRFKVDERNHQVELPKDEGLQQEKTIPKEQITISCNWDPDARANNYYVSIDNRMRRVVENSFSTLEELVIFPTDAVATARDKKARYNIIFNELVKAIENYIVTSGANIEKLEISFARSAREGAVSGTAPWMFVSLAIDACTMVNNNRRAANQEELIVTFKFADSMQRFTG